MPYNGRPRLYPPRSSPDSLAYHYGDHYRSRYTGSRYDGDRRSRSPSPYRDRENRGSQYGDGDRRRPSAESRANTTAFQSNRDAFRDSLTGREPPRGPKALIDPPIGPRGGGFAGDFRGRGRGGGGRGRPWRDDSRDRGRDRDPEYRDRPHFRDDRSREREREWRDRDRDGGFNRGRRPSPGGRGRSPPGRDFRDGRDVPLGVDAERARRGSRDGPLSAGSSNSDPPFGPSSFRGGFSRGGRGRGRGDWEPRGGGRGRGSNFYDDHRDRYGPGLRSRSQEGRWGRDPDDRDRRDLRYDSARDLRDDREPRDWVERDLLPRKIDRVSHEPPPLTKDVSPPPLAPSAPAFGSVPARQPSSTDIQSLTGKAPPTGPRALTEERPVSAGHAIATDRPPHGASLKPSLPDGSPPIPVGPRAQQQKQQLQQQQQPRSSKQWINPALAGKKIPESPKLGRSQSFVSQQPRPFNSSYRPESSHSDQHGEFDRRPRSSDAHSDPHAATDGPRQSNNSSALIKPEKSPHSTRVSVDHDTKPTFDGDDTKMVDAHVQEEARTEKAAPDEKEVDRVVGDNVASGVSATSSTAAGATKTGNPRREPDELSDAGPAKKRRIVPPLEPFRVQLPPRQASAAPVYQSSESDDDEDYDAYFDQQITSAEADLRRFENTARLDVPTGIVKRHARLELEVLGTVLNDLVSLTDLIGPVPEGFSFPCAKPGTELEKTKELVAEEPRPEQQQQLELQAEPPADTQVDTELQLQLEQQFRDVQSDQREGPEERAQQLEQKGTEAEAEPEPEPKSQPQQPPQPTTPIRESSAIPTVEHEDEPSDHHQQPEPMPKLEEMDTEGSGLPPLPSVEQARVDDEDVDMHDVGDVHHGVLGPLAPVNGMPPNENGLAIFPAEFAHPISEGNSASPPDADADSEDKTEDDASIYGSTEAVREYSATPPTDELPPFHLKPWCESKKFRQSAEPMPGFDSFLRGQMHAHETTKSSEQEELRQEYRKTYEVYLRFTHSDDPAAIKSRDYFANKPAGTSANGKSSAGQESKAEGSRRAARFSTELDLETAIQQSLKEHKEKQEREERAQKEKYRTDKEAVIPPMFWTAEDKEKGLFNDRAGRLPLEKLIATWQVVPWHVNFTQEEAEKFEKAYLESPKQWGKIASDLPDRDFGTCIQYYYAKKRELNLKEKLRKQPRKRRKKGGKQRSSALVSELGNTENETEEQQENGDGTERARRPRRAAAPTWGFETTQNADSDGATPNATPGRRRAGTLAEAKNDSGAEKAEPKKPGRKARQPKADKEAKVPKPTQNLAPTPPAAQSKGNRSRSNSRPQGPEWLSPQTPADLGQARPGPPHHAPQFEVTPAGHGQGAGHGVVGGMQPPMGPVQHQPLASPERERAAPPMQSTLSDMMAPPQLRPDPIPPQASVPTFEIGHPGGSERGRNAQQASSYWSVAEATDFPHLLKAFGTDWGAIAAHMQTKTAVMVKNYYVRQKDGGKSEWEALATEADSKLARGEKRPAPPAPSTGPRKRYDVPSAGHRPLAAAESEDRPPAKSEASPQPFSRFPVPIAQASPVPHSLAPPTSNVMTAAVSSPTAPPPSLLPSQQPPQQQQQQQPQLQSQPPQVQTQPQPPQPRHISPPLASMTSQTMSPNIRPRVPQPSPFTYSDREAEPVPPPPQPQQLQQAPAQQLQQQQPVRISQKPAPLPVSGPPVTEPGRLGWVSDYEQQMHSMLSQQQHEKQMSAMAQQQKRAQEQREPRERQVRVEPPQRDPIRIVERPPVRLKQEPEHPMHHQEFQQYQPQPPPQRVMQPRNEPIALARQPEPPHGMPQTTQRPYTPPVQPQSARNIMGDHGVIPHGHPQMSGMERPMSAVQRPMPPTSMQEQFVPVTMSAPQRPAQSLTPAPSRPVERKTSNLMALLNEDPPAPPKRVNEVAGIKPNPTPPPSSGPPLSARVPPPTSMPAQQRREVEGPGYPYPRSAGPQSAIPSLKPAPHPHSPQPQLQHINGPRSAIVSPMDSPVSAVDAQRDYYRNPHHFQPQHQASASNSPQSQQVHHYPPSAQHEQRIAQQHAQHAQQTQQSQQSPMSYQPPQSYQSYPVTQPHAASPTQQYAPHPSMAGRRDVLPSGREGWSQSQQPSASSLQQQQVQPPPHPQQQTSWPHQAPPKTNQPSPWAAQHGVQPKPPINSSVPGQQHSWSPSVPPQQPHPLNLRESRGQSVYGSHESHSPVPMGHQHHRSIGSSQYPAPDPRRGEPGPPQPGQPPYARYSNTPGPGQGRDHPARSYTPVGTFDARGGPPPGPAYAAQESIIRDAQMREAQHQMREIGGGGRDPRGDPRELAVREQQMGARDLRELAAAREQQLREQQQREQQQQQQQQHPMGSMLQRQLRPGPQQHDNVYDRGPPDQRYR